MRDDGAVLRVRVNEPLISRAWTRYCWAMAGFLVRTYSIAMYSSGRWQPDMYRAAVQYAAMAWSCSRCTRRQ